MASTAEPTSPPMADVVGRYVLCDEIAAGGMATVHLGRLRGSAGFARTVAIKRLHSQFAKDPDFVAMFLDEARLAGGIRHPNVVPTLDVLIHDGEILVVMEYVHGESLARLTRIQRTGRDPRGAPTSVGVPLPIALSIVSGALYGLHAAHEARDDRGAPLEIVHRDVSPQNILIGLDGVVRVVDFGVAKAAGRLQMTREGTLKGKLAYMAPEQASSDTVDRRCDIYAAAVVLWEALTGTRLFSGQNEMSLFRSVLAGAVTPPSAIVPGIPPEVDALVMRGLAPEPEGRFSTALEMAEAAQRIAYATPGQVGAWVRSLGGAGLEARAARVAAIERAFAADAPALPDLAPPSAPTRPPYKPSGNVDPNASSSRPTRPTSHIHLGGSAPSMEDVSTVEDPTRVPSRPPGAGQVGAGQVGALGGGGLGLMGAGGPLGLMAAPTPLLGPAPTIGIGVRAPSSSELSATPVRPPRQLAQTVPLPPPSASSAFGSSSAESASIEIAPADVASQIITSVNIAAAQPRRPSRLPIIALAVLIPCALVLVVGVIAASRASSPLGSASTATPSSMETAAPAAAAPAVPAAPTAVANAASAAAANATAEPSLPTPSADATAPAKAPSRPAAPPPAAKAGGRAGGAKPGCSPPYTVDARGVRVPKMECL